MARQPVRRTRPHTRSGEGLPDRTGAHETLLLGGPRAHHQSRSGPPGIPRQHRHDAVHHPHARGPQRQAPHSRQPGSVAQPLPEPSARQVRRQAHQDGHQLERAGRRAGSALRALPQGGGERAAEDLHGDRRYRPQSLYPARRGHGGPPGARVSHLRQPVSAVQRIARHFGKIHRPVPGSDGGHRQGEGRGVALRHGGHLPGAGELFDAGRNGVKLLLGVTAPITDPHGKMLDLMAGNSADSETHDQMVQDLMRILEAQRTVSLDTLFQLADHIESVSKGEKLDPKLVNKLASRISEIQLPRGSLSATEKNAIGFGYWTERHLDAERRLNLRAAIEKAAGDPEKVRETRALLAPLLRDTLLSFNYAHYAPPGAQILYTNPVFVRSHDFLGMQGADHTWRPTELYGTGWPSNGGGRLVGSLSSLPYALAEAEQNFLVPAQTQALIWGDLVPQMILSAKIPRFWQVTPAQLHWVGLHLRYGRELLAEAALSSDLRTQVVASLGTLAAPARTHQVAQLLEQGAVPEAVDRVTPSEMYLIAREVGAGRNPRAIRYISD